MNAIINGFILIIAIGIVLFVGLFLIGLIVDLLLTVLPFLIAATAAIFVFKKIFFKKGGP